MSDDFADGVYFVALQPLRDAEAIVTAIIDALPLQLAGSAEPRALVLHYLREKQLLLMLDNFEHLLDGVPVLTEILRSAPQVKLLLTSRERLNLQAEQVWPLVGLELPDERTESPDLSSAVQLFVERAQRVKPDFAFDAQRKSVIRICRLVEGLPLALELAASWTRVHAL